MSIETIYEGDERAFVATCDMCGDTLEPEDEFMDAVEAKKSAGWRSKLIDGFWDDVCPACQERREAAKKTKEAYNNAKNREIMKKRRK